MSAAYTKAQTGQDIRPGWEGNAIAKRLVARGVCTLSVALAVFSYPCAYICLTVRKSLQAFTFQRGKTADGQPFGVNHAVKVLLIRHPLSPPRISCGESVDDLPTVPVLVHIKFSLPPP